MNFRATQYVFGTIVCVMVYMQASTAYAFFGLFGSDSFGISQIAENIVNSSQNLPGLLTGIAYSVGLLLGALGITDLKSHVENAQQTPLKNGMIKLLAGGALFSLPAVLQAMNNAVNPGDIEFGVNGGVGNFWSDFMGMISGIIPTASVNQVFAAMISSIEKLPGAISAIAYLLGLLLGYMGVVKIKEHVENPDQVKLHEGVIRLIIGGALFSIPSIYTAMQAAIEGEGTGFLDDVTAVFGTSQIFWSSEDANVACSPISIPFLGAVLGGSSSLGNVACNIIRGVGAFPSFLAAIAYLFGLVLGIMGLLKIRDHVLNPQQTPIWESVQRLVAGGAFFALPTVIAAIRNTVVPESLNIASSTVTNTGFNMSGGGWLNDIVGSVIGGVLGIGGGCMPGTGSDVIDGAISSISTYLGFGLGSSGGGGGGLDAALACFMSDIFGPVHVLLNFFGIVAGTILIMIGISRLLKSSQDGARGPGGLGTIMTFAVGGALISFNSLIRAFSTSLFGSPITFTYANLNYTTGMTSAEISSTHMVISSVLKFMILVGLISFVRGLFIMRDVAEGNQQASMMSSVTHLVGGALAVNLGPMLNAVQATLGITGFGITFS